MIPLAPQFGDHIIMPRIRNTGTGNPRVLSSLFCKNKTPPAAIVISNYASKAPPIAQKMQHNAYAYASLPYNRRAIYLVCHPVECNI